jgi:hypothetical protein
VTDAPTFLLANLAALPESARAEARELADRLRDLDVIVVEAGDRDRVLAGLRVVARAPAVVSVGEMLSGPLRTAMEELAKVNEPALPMAKSWAEEIIDAAPKWDGPTGEPNRQQKRDPRGRLGRRDWRKK